MLELPVWLSSAVFALAGIIPTCAREESSNRMGRCLDIPCGGAMNSELSDHLTLDPPGERLEWTRIERDERSRTSSQRLLASFEVPRPPAVACLELGRDRWLLVGGDAIGGWLLELGLRRAGEVAAFEVREALELEVLPRAACFDAREGILYVVDGRSHALWCAALDIADGEPLRSGAFVRALEGVGSRLLADRGGVEAGLVNVRLEEADAARLRLVHAARSFSESHPRWRGGRRALPAPSRELRWRIEATPLHELATHGFWVRGPRGSFEVLEMPSQRVIGRGAIAEERAFFAGEGRLASGIAYAVRGEGAARSVALVARSRVGEPRGTEELAIGRVQLRRRATRAGEQLWFSAGLRCAHASPSEREALVWLELSVPASGFSPALRAEARELLLEAEVVWSRARSVAAGQQALRGPELDAWPAWMVLGGVELQARVAGWLAGEREIACSDVLGFRLE